LIDDFLKFAILRENNYEKASICEYKPHPNNGRKD